MAGLFQSRAGLQAEIIVRRHVLNVLRAVISGARNKAIRLWDVAVEREVARLEVDGFVFCLTFLRSRCFIGGDGLGRLHWLEVLAVPSHSKRRVWHTRTEVSSSVSWQSQIADSRASSLVERIALPKPVWPVEGQVHAMHWFTKPRTCPGWLHWRRRRRENRLLRQRFLAATSA
jgi:hypothetical protein